MKELNSQLGKDEKGVAMKILAYSLSARYFFEVSLFETKRLTTEECNVEFDNLMIKCDIVESEKQTIAQYLEGLRLEIGNVLQLQHYWSYNDVSKRVL